MGGGPGRTPPPVISIPFADPMPDMYAHTRRRAALLRLRASGPPPGHMRALQATVGGSPGQSKNPTTGGTTAAKGRLMRQPNHRGNARARPPHGLRSRPQVRRAEEASAEGKPWSYPADSCASRCRWSGVVARERSVHNTQLHKGSGLGVGWMQGGHLRFPAALCGDAGTPHTDSQPTDPCRHSSLIW